MMICNAVRAKSQLMQALKKCALALALIAAGLCLAVSLGGAHKAYANELRTAGSFIEGNEITAITAKEQKAYERALKACLDYENQPNPIVIDMSDLNLTSEQALNVGEMLHSNGELFFINTYNDSSYGTDAFTLPCNHDDATITKMRTQLDNAVAKALKRIGPKMNAPLRVHMLHDYVIDRIDYTAGKKNAYTGLVEGKGDCFGYALSLDLLLRRAGFTVDMAYNDRLDHAWNQVKIGSSWFHVDPTFDKTFSYTKISENYTGDYFDWTHERCHIYLLQSDTRMSQAHVDPYTRWSMSSHYGWRAHHKCTNTKYDANKTCGVGGTFSKACNAYKGIVLKFKASGIQYNTITENKTQPTSVVGKTQKKAKTITIPATIKYNKVKYYVTGLAPRAFTKAKAKTLKIGSAKLTKASVRNSLRASKITTVKLYGPAKKKLKAYKKIFTKANCGRKVTVKK